MITPTAQEFADAQIISDAAAMMDSLKRIHVPKVNAEAAQMAGMLHDIAERLAGDRVGEIYAPEQKPEEQKK